MENAVPRQHGWAAVCMVRVLDGRMLHFNCQKDQSKRWWQLFVAGWGGRAAGRPGRRKTAVHVCSAETSEQSKPQMPLLINTRCEADVYQAQFREKKPGKAGEIHAPQTRDFLGEGVAGNGFCKFLLLITTSQTKSKETFPSY